MPMAFIRGTHQSISHKYKLKRGLAPTPLLPRPYLPAERTSPFPSRQTDRIQYYTISEENDSMALTYEEALETICSMFEGWDRETITAVFESNGYHVERTIETILSMEQPNTDSNAPNSGTTRFAGRITYCTKILLVLLICTVVSKICSTFRMKRRSRSQPGQQLHRAAPQYQQYHTRAEAFLVNSQTTF